MRSAVPELPCLESPSRRRWMVRCIPLGLVIGFVVAWGANRQPADATTPIVWQEPVTLAEPSPNTLRIASFNIHSGKGADNRLDLSRTADELVGIDFAGLYEVRAQPWGQPADQAAALGDRLKMRSVFLGTERRWWHDHFGNAVLTTRPIAGLQRLPLIGTRGKAFRQAVLADVPLLDQTVHIVLVHIDREQDREQQLAAVIRVFLSLEPPSILMGDLNSRSSDPQIQTLLSQPGIENVLNALPEVSKPTNTIDWLVTHGLETVTVQYGDIGASDHPIIKAELRLPQSR